MMDLEIGRLLRAGSAGFVVGCRVAQLDSPSFGALIRVPLEGDYQIYGLIHDIHIDDDGLVRQLVTAENVEESIIADNRQNRNVPIEVSVMTVGYREGGRIYHLLPPRPALSLDTIYLCDERELCEFTGVGRFGYFRHVLRNRDIPTEELLAAHLKQARQAHLSCGNAGWFDAATQELITILRDDYAALMSVLSAISDL
jgi:hypothetical protein